MDYRKIEAALAAAMEDVQDPEEPVLAVFIHTEHAPRGDGTKLLRRLGISGIVAGRQVFTVTLSVRAVEELSEQPWVKCIKLSKKLKLLKVK